MFEDKKQRKRNHSDAIATDSENATSSKSVVTEAISQVLMHKDAILRLTEAICACYCSYLRVLNQPFI